MPLWLMAGGRNYIEQDMQATTVRNLYDIFCIGATKRYIYIHRHRERDIYIYIPLYNIHMDTAVKSSNKDKHQI